MMLRHSRAWALFALGSIAGLLFLSLAQPISVAAATPSAAVRGTIMLGASGGKVTLRVYVHGARSCRYSADTEVSGFTGVARCTTGVFTRTGRVGVNTGAKRYIDLNVRVVSGSKSKYLIWVVTQQALLAPTTTTTTTTPANDVVTETYFSAFTTSEAGFVTTVPETLTWSWVNGNGNYASGFGVYNMYTDSYLVNYELNPTGVTLNSAPGANGSITLPPGTYWLDIQAIGPWKVVIN